MNLPPHPPTPTPSTTSPSPTPPSPVPPTPVPPTPTRRRRRFWLIGTPIIVTTAFLAGAVSAVVRADDTSGTAAAAATSSAGGGSSSSGAVAAGELTTVAAGDLLDDTAVHSISVTFDEAEYDAMIEAYQSSSDKEWISATVTVDGETYENVGLRLKGNSSLRSLSGRGGPAGPGGEVSAEDPETLPWLIKFDKFVDGQDHDGVEELVIRSNVTETALNEAVALDLMELAGLASQQAVATTFSVNDSDAVLRLAVEHPDDEWVERVFGTDGSLYKAESTGDYSYRGDDAAEYEEVFDLESGDDETLEHLTAFLEFINESDDTTFAAELPSWLDVDAFATYLAMQDLVDNFDDIDGPGNNSYLYYDPSTDQMTVVPWDLNLAFGVMGGTPATDGTQAGGGQAGAPVMPGGQAGGQAGGPAGGGRPGGFGRSNVLVTRFLENETFAAMKADALAELQAALFDSGQATEVLERWTALLDEAGVVDAATLASESEALASKLSA